MITGVQIKASRELLGWSHETLAMQAQQSVIDVVRMEEGAFVGKHVNISRLRILKAFEAAGVEFTPENGGGAGVRLRKGPS